MARGSYRHSVLFEDPGDPIPDGEGGFTEGWTALVPPLWFVAIRPATARDLESDTAGTVTASATHIVIGDYHAGVTTATRMIYDGRIFQVTGVSNREERDRTMHLFCEERL